MYTKPPKRKPEIAPVIPTAVQTILLKSAPKAIPTTRATMTERTPQAIELKAPKIPASKTMKLVMEIAPMPAAMYGNHLFPHMAMIGPTRRKAIPRTVGFSESHLTRELAVYS